MSAKAPLGSHHGSQPYGSPRDSQPLGSRGSQPYGSPRHGSRRHGAVLRRAALATLALLAPGCPVYEDHCDSRSDCAPGFRCNVYSGDCELVVDRPGRLCDEPRDCRVGETCGEAGRCQPGSCVYRGCVAGYTCAVVDELHTCVPSDGAPSDAGPGEEPADASVDASTPTDAALDAAPSDASSDAAADATP